MKTYRRLAVYTAIALIAWSLAFAEIPRLISYQGKVTESGQVVADGNYTMRFRIYNDPSSGTLRWDSGNQTVQVTDGIFNILLGESGQPTLDLSFDEDLWILVTFEGVNQTPRQRIVSAGYAYMASGIVPGTEVSGAVTSGSGASLFVENTATSICHGIIGETNGTYGVGVKGVSTNSEGLGVYGLASALSGTTYGVCGQSASSTGYGVYGEIVSTQTGTAYGVYGKTNATEGATYGVYGTINSAYGAGVYGVSSNSGSTLSYGVKGSYNADGVGAGVHGEATTTSPGESPSGVSGIAWATSGTAYGGSFSSQSTSGRGVYGEAVASSGSAWGVYGLGNSTAGGGVYGIAEPNNVADAVGVVGHCEPADYYGIGVAAEGTYRALLAVCSTSGSSGGVYYGGYLMGQVSGSTGTVYGVYGEASGGSTHYGVYYSGGINGSGVMRNTIRTDDGPVSMYVQQATENWFEDFGTGVIGNGKARVALREDYRNTITANEDHPVKVFVTPTARLGEWWVEKSSQGFVIHAPEAPDDATFDYRIVGKRKNAENLRLESMPSGYTDEGLYPDDAAVPAEYLRERQKSKRAQVMDLE